jgi:hypothetical protein
MSNELKRKTFAIVTDDELCIAISGVCSGMV